MTWIVVTKREKPAKSKRVWISFMQTGIITSQKQTYARIVGKDEDREPIWLDEITGKYIDNRKFTITHYMPLPDNPILVSGIK